MSWYEEASVQELLTGYANTLKELRQRGVLRTNNAPLGDYPEWLMAESLDGELEQSTSAKSHDLTLADGSRVQVKARLVSEPLTAGQTQTSAFRSWDFDLAALVLLRADDYRVASAFLVPVDVVRHHSRFRKHINASIVFIRPPLTTAPTAQDITTQVASTAEQLR